MASRERVVEFAVKARDEYSKVLKNLEQQQQKLSAAAKAQSRRAVVGIAQSEVDDALANYKRLTSEVERYRAVQANAAQTGKLSEAEMRELGDAIKLTRDRAREAVDVYQQKRAALLQLNSTATVGYGAFDRLAVSMQRGATAAVEESAALASDAVALKRIETASKATASAQGALKTKIDSTTSAIDRQRKKSGSSNAKGNAQDVLVFGLKPWQLTNLGYQINDVVSGLAMGQAPLQVLSQQAGQFAQIWPNVMVTLARSVPVIAGFTAVLSPFVAAALRLHSVNESVEQFRQQLALSADGSRYDAQALADVVVQMERVGISTDDARKAVSGFVREGISAKGMLPLAEMAKQFAQVQGLSFTDAAKKLGEAFNGSIGDIRKLDEEYNIFSATQLQTIAAMDKAGDRAGALGLAQSILAEKLANSKGEASDWALAVQAMADAWNNLVEAVENSGLVGIIVDELAKMSRDFKRTADDFKRWSNFLKGMSGGPDLEKQIADVKALLEQERQLAKAGWSDDSGVKQLEDRLAALESIRDSLKEIDAAGKAGAENQKRTGDLTEEERKARDAIQAAVDKYLATVREGASQEALTERELFIQKTLKEAQNDAQKEAIRLGKEYLGLTKEQTDAIREQAGAAYDQGVGGKYARGEGLSPFVKKVIGAEYGNGSVEKNPNSSATGPGQFIKSTWLEMFKKYFPDRAESMSKEAILLLRKDSAISSAMIEKYAQENAAVLQKAGVSVNDAALYLAHFLGPQGAINVLRAAPTTALTELLGKDQIAANQSVLGGKTAGQLVEWAQKKMQINNAELEVNTRLGEMNEKYLEDYNKRIEAEKFELDIMSKTAKQQAIAKAVHDEELKAKEAGLELTKEQRAEVEKLAAAEFDRKNVNLEVNELLEKRSALFESLQIAQTAGDQSKVVSTVNEIANVEQQLNTAIEKAIAFWEAIGGPGADQAIAKLRNVQAAIGESVAKIEKQFLPKAEDLNEQLADIGGNAFSSFAQAIANGENAAQAFFDTLMKGIADFLIEIGKAIIKQALFNALSGGAGANGAGGIGGAIVGAIAKIFHEGGIGGGRAPTRVVNPAIFTNAKRYHGGGGPKLGRGEVPAIIMDDEEVIRRDDPRHILNGGGRAAAINVKNVNVFNPTDVLEAALQTTLGERVLLNYLTRNARKVSAAISGSS